VQPSDDSKRNAAFDNMSVFIVDDEPAIREGLALILKQKGFKVNSSDGTDCENCNALTAEMSVPPDIIVADFRLQHGRTGIDTIKCLRKTFKQDIPAILITGDTAPERLVEAKRSGLPILHKPVNADDLLQAILDAKEA